MAEVRGVLLDTHAVLWAVGGDARLGAGVASALRGGAIAWVSTATVWELGIKVALGRLTLDVPVRELVRRMIREGGVQVLDIVPEHALHAAELPLHHRDPFDRMLVAQARVESLTLASRDAQIARYDVPIVW